MSQTISQTPGRIIPEDRMTRIFAVIILLLAYSATTQYIVGPSLEVLVRQNAAENQFTDAAALLTFMRLGLILWVVAVSFLQAVSLRLIYKGVVRGPTPTTSTSWCWALMGQVPFIVAGLGVMLITDGDGAALMGGLPLRVAFGVISAALYTYFARRAYRAEGARLGVFFFIVAAVNSVLLFAVSAT